MRDTTKHINVSTMSAEDLRAHIEELNQEIKEKESEAATLRAQNAEKGTKMKALNADIRDLRRQLKDMEALADARQQEIDRQEQMLQEGGVTLGEREAEIDRLRRELAAVNPVEQAQREAQAAQLRRETAELDAESQRREAQAQRREAQLLALGRRIMVGLIAAAAVFVPTIPGLWIESIGFSVYLHVIPSILAFAVFFLYPGFAAWLKKATLATGEFIVSVIEFFARVAQIVIETTRNIGRWILRRVGINDTAMLVTAYQDAKKEWAQASLQERITKGYLRFCGLFVGAVVGMALWPEAITAEGLFISIIGGIGAMVGFNIFEGMLLKVSHHDGHKWWAIIGIYAIGIAACFGSVMVTFSELYYRQVEGSVFTQVKGDLIEAETGFLKAAQGTCEDGIRVAERKAKEAEADGDQPKAAAKRAEAKMFRDALDGMLKAQAKSKQANVWDDLPVSAQAFRDAATPVVSELDRAVQKKDPLGKVWVPEKPKMTQLGTSALLGRELQGIRLQEYTDAFWLAASLVLLFEGAILLIGFAALFMRLGRKEPTTPVTPPVA